MKKRIGKIALWTMAALVTAACAVTWMVPREAKAATYDARTLVVKPFGGETALTVVFRDIKTGNVFKTDGTSAADTAWADGEFAASQHASSGDWVITFPATNFRTLYFSYYDAAVGAVTAATTPDGTALFDVPSGMSYTDASPTADGRVKVRND